MVGRTKTDRLYNEQTEGNLYCAVYAGVTKELVPSLDIALETSIFLVFETFVCLFVCFCCFMSHVNSYGHCGTVSSLNHTFFLGRLEQAVNQ